MKQSSPASSPETGGTSPGTLLSRYTPGDKWDEMVDLSGTIRSPWTDFGNVLDTLSLQDLRERQEDVEQLLKEDGATYLPSGVARPRPWQLDPLPLIIDEASWATLQTGLVQRSELLNAVLTDIYGEQKLIKERLLPPEVVFGHEGFLRAAFGTRLPCRQQLFFSATDVARDHTGQWWVTSDRSQAPSGAGYAMENRQVVSRIFPGLYRDLSLHRLGTFFQAMRISLQSLAPHNTEAPRVVLLSPGSRSETSFDQAMLSKLLGFPVVEGSELTVRGSRVYLRSLDRLEPVDVILRRVDAEFCDPLELRPESRLGLPGLLEAARAGNVAIVNSLGSGVLENPGLTPFLARIATVVLGEDLALPNPQTWWCGDPSSLRYVLSRLDQLILRPIYRGIKGRTRAGAELSAGELDDLRREITAQPFAWVGQEPVQLSTAPVVTDRGLEPGNIVLRSFTVAHEDSYRVMPGGLPRVDRQDADFVITNQRGASAKDLWVIAANRQSIESTDDLRIAPEALNTVVSARAAEAHFWIGRYAERAENTARVLRLVKNRWNEFHASPEKAAPKVLSILLGAATAITGTWPGLSKTSSIDESEGTQNEIFSLILDEQREGSLAFCLHSLHAACDSVRDQLPSDTWVILGQLDRRINHVRKVSTPRNPNTIDIAVNFSKIIEGLLALSGVFLESLVRDTSWHFLELGRRVERAAHTALWLRETMREQQRGAVGEMLSEAALSATESIITYRRHYQPSGSISPVIELLLTSRTNPRSVNYQLDRIDEALDALPHNSGSPDPAGIFTSLLARMRSLSPDILKKTSPTGRFEALGDELNTIIDQLWALGEAIDRHYFEQPNVPHHLDATLAER